jgi:glycosyltransferase involved in cell wall biosynthesis
MKIYINRQPVNGPWGGGNLFVKAAYDFIGPEFEIVNQDPDIILIIGIDAENEKISAAQAIQYKISQSHKKNVKLVLRVNENDARKQTNHVDRSLIELSKFIDETIFVSNWIMEYFISRGWACHNNHVVKNGVDEKIFFPKIPNSSNHKIKLVTHHWSNNQLKGFDIYEKLDYWVKENPEFEFTYIGRERGTFKNSKVIPPLFGKELGDELRKHDVYISASRNDPGPNHIIESISCGLPTYVHKNGGGCIEFAGDDFMYNDWEDLEKVLLRKKFIVNQTKFDSWQGCIQSCKNILY